MLNSPWAKALKISPLALISQYELAAPYIASGKWWSWRSGGVFVTPGHSALTASLWQGLFSALLVEEVCLQ